MDKTFVVETEAPVDRLRTVLADLTTYPRWLNLVTAVTADDVGRGETTGETSGDETGRDGDAQQENHAAWLVTLRGRVGPLSRSKRLRMVRADGDGAGTTIRFERSENDGRDHATWVFEAEVAPSGDGSTATIRLHYDGGMWSTMLDGVLDGAAADATEALRDYVADRA